MAIESRGDTRKKYYAKVRRVEGKLTKEYVGRLSDPWVSMFVRDENLRKAEAAARGVEIQKEVERSKQLEPAFIAMERASRSWKVLFRIIHHPSNPNKECPMSTQPSTELPKLHRFNETCRLANQGDEEAIAQLNDWIRAAPELFAKATDAVKLAREALIEEFAGDSPETQSLLRARLRQDAAELLGATEGDPLLKHYAEVVLLAKLDLIRCQLAGFRSNLGIQVKRYWEGAVLRAEKRWIKVTDAYRKAVAERAKVARKNQ